MKKLIALFLCLALCFSAQAVIAEDLSSLTLEELTEKRRQLLEELSQVNAVRGAMLKQQADEGTSSDEALGKIINLFPDEAFAKIIRDECAKFSIEQTVTQADLDRITDPTLSFSEIHSFEGIGLLRNLRLFRMGSKYDGAFPEGLRTCKNLETIEMTYCENVTEIPEWIGELEKLVSISVQCCSLSKIPDSICSLQKLKRLYVNSNKGIKALPENIGNCVSLKELNIAYTSIETLPDSIWNLQLTSLDMSGTSIR